MLQGGVSGKVACCTPGAYRLVTSVEQVMDGVVRADVRQECVREEVPGGVYTGRVPGGYMAAIQALREAILRVSRLSGSQGGLTEANMALRRAAS